MKLEVTKIRPGRWAIQPEGTLGTCGWINGIAWTVEYTSNKPINIPIRGD